MSLVQWYCSKQNDENRTQRQVLIKAGFHSLFIAFYIQFPSFYISVAATSALELDPHDGKALYRRAQAHLHLGSLPAAKNDYMAILKSEYTSTQSKMNARDGLREMRKIVTKWKADVAKIMEETTNHVRKKNR